MNNTRKERKSFGIIICMLMPMFLGLACTQKDNNSVQSQATDTQKTSTSQNEVVVSDKPVLDAGYVALFAKAKEMVAESLVRNPKNFSAPRYYDELPVRQNTGSGNEFIEVTEFFSYGCPACFNAEPAMQAFESQLAPDVRFVRVPASFNSTFEMLARGYYAANSLGAGEEAHIALFDAYHVKRMNLSSEKALADFYSHYGVDKDKFLKALHSFSVNSMIERDKKLAQNYQVSGVPSVIVNGKYNTGGKKAGSMDVWVQILDTLIEKERALK